MSLHEKLSSINIDTPYDKYLRTNRKYSLKLNELHLNVQDGLYMHNEVGDDLQNQFKKVSEKLVSSKRDDISGVINSNAALVLQYKGKDVSIMNINEYGNEELWNILHIGGVKGNHSYRVCSGLQYIDFLTDMFKAYAEHPDSHVKYLTMPDLKNIPHLNNIYEETIGMGGIMEEDREVYRIYNSKRNNYSQLISRLGLKHSQELDCNILEVKKNITV